MGNIIQLPARASRPRRARVDGNPGHTCQIIILPCVRYERWASESIAPARHKAKKKTKRRARAR